MLMYSVTNTINGETELLAIFKYREDAVKYIHDELYEPIAESLDYGYIEIENTYNIHTIRLKNLDITEIT